MMMSGFLESRSLAAQHMKELGGVVQVGRLDLFLGEALEERSRRARSLPALAL